MKKLFPLVFLLFSMALSARITYFVDDIAGNDSNSGKGIHQSWKTVERINKTVFQPGDSILFRRSGTWKGNLTPRGSGISGKPIVMASYGSGPLPVLDAQGVVANGEKASYTIRLFNQEFWEFKNLRIKNYKPFEKPEKYEDAFSNSVKVGIYVEGRDAGILRHLHFTGLEICDINGAMSTKDNGGIFIEVTRDEDSLKWKPTRFDDVVLQDSYIHNVDRTGFSNFSVWKDRNLTSTWGDRLAGGKTDCWYPWEGMVFRNNTFARTGANALIVRVAIAPLVEYNLFTHCAVNGSGNASFPFNCDDAVFQHNEACFTVFNTEADSWDGKRDADAAGFDSDWNCKNTVIQYNYSHHNGYGGLLVCLDGSNKNGFNEGTIVRYNILEENGHHGIRISGTPTRTMVYNNLIYTGNDQDSVMTVFHKSWGGWSKSALYQNNIFVARGKGCRFEPGKSTGNRFVSNLYFGAFSGMPDDSLKITGDPGFISEMGTLGPYPWMRFMLEESSPAINAAVRIIGSGEKDFTGKPVVNPPDIGPLEYRVLSN
jgi:hypothetical protein